MSEFLAARTFRVFETSLAAGKLSKPEHVDPDAPLAMGKESTFGRQSLMPGLISDLSNTCVLSTWLLFPLAMEPVLDGWTHFLHMSLSSLSDAETANVFLPT